ncbi:hypothetical protein GIB67_011550 [Kingdonia uniflora]|uniref:Uncharacterized protein n=1 Tax=Kingdonia uniflora TaxID=39325 RepID=A0A7J7NLU6_9MAGN|nr:hypothetical protein GIB67_011550 [Kingdonia uniflora]
MIFKRVLNRRWGGFGYSLFKLNGIGAGLGVGQFGRYGDGIAPPAPNPTYHTPKSSNW